MPPIPVDCLLKGYSPLVSDELQILQLRSIRRVVDFGR